MFFTASHTIDDISTAKAKYVQQDLKDIAGYYHLKHGNFQVNPFFSRLNFR